MATWTNKVQRVGGMTIFSNNGNLWNQSTQGAGIYTYGRSGYNGTYVVGCLCITGGSGIWQWYFIRATPDSGDINCVGVKIVADNKSSALSVYLDGDTLHANLLNNTNYRYDYTISANTCSLEIPGYSTAGTQLISDSTTVNGQSWTTTSGNLPFAGYAAFSVGAV